MRADAMARHLARRRAIGGEAAIEHERERPALRFGQGVDFGHAFTRRVANGRIILPPLEPPTPMPPRKKAAVTLRLIARMRRFARVAAAYLRIFLRQIINYAAIMIMPQAVLGC